MKNNWLNIVFILVFSQFVIAQSDNSCVLNYKAELTASPIEARNSEKYAVLDWDFSSIKDAAIKIEVLPINDCFKKEKALSFKNVIILNIDNKENKLVGSKKLMHLEMLSKCFKWRVFITKGNCQKVSDWQYHSFINNKK